MMELKINTHGGPELERHGDWYDLYAAETVFLDQGEYKIISLGVSMSLPVGYEAHVLPRSSTFKKYGILLVNGMGIIDNDYGGDHDVWGFPALAVRPTCILAGARIAQFRIVKNMPRTDIQYVDHLNGPNRGGFGSSGI